MRHGAIINLQHDYWAWRNSLIEEEVDEIGDDIVGSSADNDNQEDSHQSVCLDAVQLHVALHHTLVGQAHNGDGAMPWKWLGAKACVALLGQLTATASAHAACCKA